MLIYDDTFEWEGFGGKLKLVSGKCRLRIIDRRTPDDKVAIVRPILVVVSDLSDEGGISVKSCSGHIATRITEQFNINPSRMFYIEYYEQTIYGENFKKIIPERFETIDFEWHDGKAIHPKARPLQDSVINIVKEELSLTT